MAKLQSGSTEAEIMTLPTWMYLKKEPEVAATVEHVLSVVIMQLPLLPEYIENQTELLAEIPVSGACMSSVSRESSIVHWLAFAASTEMST